MGIIKLDESNFNAEIKEYAGVALIDFYADWCGPCKMVSPIVDEIAEEYNNYKICKVNVDEAPRLAEQFSVMSIPTLVVYKNGVKTAQAVGGKSAEEILALVNRE